MTQHSTIAHEGNSGLQEAAAIELDFDSDEPLPVCPMRKDGSGADEVCEACQ